ncbi:MAG: D-glycero-alpha-D-manno-heptose-1,7-bisphosphate 7-phosphatase [Chloroflexota bacterium]
MNHKAVFIDKDGTLIENVPYNVDPDKVRLAPGALDGLARLHAAGFKLIVVSNQSGVARGHFAEQALQGVAARLEQLLGQAGLPLTAFYYCPHLPDSPLRAYAVECFCRKPRPGLLFQAAREHELNLSACWMIGDILDDVEAGRRAGCTTVLLDNGGETEWQISPLRTPHYRVPGLDVAAGLILAETGQPAAPPRPHPADARPRRRPSAGRPPVSPGD